MASLSKAESVWAELKAAEVSMKKRLEGVAAREAHQLQEPAVNSHMALGPSLPAYSVKDLLLGRIKSKAGQGDKPKPRVFAGPVSWISRPVQAQSATSESLQSDARPGGAASAAADPAARAPAGCTPDETPSVQVQTSAEGHEEGAALERFSAAVAANALAAAKVATSLVVDDTSKIEVREVKDFAGQTVEVKRLVDAESKAAKAAKRKAEMQAASSRGLDALLAQLEKKKKLNILDKTRKDWDEYKEGAGVVDELEEYKRSGGTYTEKVAFLSRADVREYEKERDLRMSSRPLPGSGSRS